MKLKIKKGLDLRLKGTIPNNSLVEIKVGCVAIYPDDFEGFIPKADVKAGHRVACGDTLLHHKKDERIKIVSPVNGTVRAVERGERRHIDRIVIDCDTAADLQPRRFNKPGHSAQALMEFLAESGTMAFIRQRPYAIVPALSAPRDIFVTGFDSSPLAPERLWDKPDTEALQKGADILAAICKDNVYLSKRPDSTLPELKNVRQVIIRGPHPAGLPGVQAANIRPVNKGEIVWTLSAETMWRIGKLYIDGHFDATTLVGVCGSCVKNPYIAKTVIGAAIEPLLENGHPVDNRHLRIISGNVLTGEKENIDGFLHFPYTQLTVIPEGDDVDEFMGWASLSPNKMSISPSFPGWLLRRTFNPDARINGGRRAFIMSGLFEKVLPMDILPEALLKTIKSKNIEDMEKLGIYEVAPEDFALAECIDSSKQPLQQIIKEGLEYLRKELQ